ncbi:MAG: DUF2779 domain-containing protein [Acidobacteria bacterium]|nr:DUF2779 domain-containing protein [Acidobacteriota bacterium]
MKITKTDFLQYRNCPKSLWLLKHDPENYPEGEFSAFLRKLIREGYEVESYVQKYFKNAGERIVEFQRVFETDDGLYARADILEQTSDGKTILYEVKSSTRVKTDNTHNHLKDACFQKICAVRAGLNLDKVFLVHLNGEYVRKGDIEPEQLLVFVDVTKDIEHITSETEKEINDALELLKQTDIDKNSCTCLHKSRTNHCDTFSIFNPNVPIPSIYSIPRLNATKRDDLIAKQIFALGEIPDDYPLSDNQRIVINAAKNARPQINMGEIQRFLSQLVFPLYFFDFETFASAVPLIDGTSPHKHFPVQYSLHIMQKDGSLTHREFLERQRSLPSHLVEQMQEDIGIEGSIVSWHASFEKTQNNEMTKLFPDKNDFLMDINKRMVDLEELFKSAYVDARFDGSTSIKKVLPVICPCLNYEDLQVQEGSVAMEAWQRMVNAEEEEAKKIANDLLLYCERDTFAMVEIYRFLNSLFN